MTTFVPTLRWFCLIVLLLLLPLCVQGQQSPDKRFPLFTYLTSSPVPTLVSYTPSELDPRQEANQRRLATRSIRADLEALRPAFDGLVLYGYNEGCTPRILSVARDLKYRAVLLAIWDPKSTNEIDGVAELAREYEKDLAIGILVGNEGLTFNRYEAEDLTIAAQRLRSRIPKTVPLATTEPLTVSQRDTVLKFGDFLMPNIHPVFDRPQFGAEEAAAWARSEAVALAKKSGKPVLLKETGFPHGGKDIYSPEKQQAFWSAYVKPGLLTAVPGATANWVCYGVAFEAFDLPWKSEASGLPLEKSWGMLSPRREPYPTFLVWKNLREKAR